MKCKTQRDFNLEFIESLEFIKEKALRLKKFEIQTIEITNLENCNYTFDPKGGLILAYLEIDVRNNTNQNWVLINKYLDHSETEEQKCFFRVKQPNVQQYFDISLGVTWQASQLTIRKIKNEVGFDLDHQNSFNIANSTLTSPFANILTIATQPSEVSPSTYITANASSQNTTTNNLSGRSGQGWGSHTHSQSHSHSIPAHSHGPDRHRHWHTHTHTLASHVHNGVNHSHAVSAVQQIPILNRGRIIILRWSY